MTDPSYTNAYSAGYADGIAAEKSVASPDLQVLSLANALDALALHCANLPRSHDACLECECAILLGRVVHMSDNLRERSL